jgi:hypothetical protein
VVAGPPPTHVNRVRLHRGGGFAADGNPPYGLGNAFGAKNLWSPNDGRNRAATEKRQRKGS